jgi:uncharacterized protein DUF6994
VNHFLLNDLVTKRCVKFYTELDAFTGDPMPAGSVAEYREYMRRSMDFVQARNECIACYAASMLAETGLE